MSNRIDSDAYRAAYEKGTDSVLNPESTGRNPRSSVGLLVFGAILASSLFLSPVEGAPLPEPTATATRPNLVRVDGQLCTGPYIDENRGPYICDGVTEQGTLIQFNTDGTRYIEAPNGARITE